MLLVGTAGVGVEWRLWPLISWPMYARAFDPPGDSVELPRLRAIGPDGRTHEVAAENHLGVGRETVVYRVIEAAVGSPDPGTRRAARAHLVAMLGRALPGVAIAEVEIVRLRFDVDVTARPPLDLAAPRSREVRVRFDARSGDTRPR